MSYSIGEFAKRTQLGIHTLRYYEQERLRTAGNAMPPTAAVRPRKTSNGWNLSNA